MIKETLLNLKEPGYYGLMAPAGSGKTTICNDLEKNHGIKIIHVDDYFIGDSEFRKRLARVKQDNGYQELIDFYNQMNWWNWEKLEIDMSIIPDQPVIIEGAILGPTAIRNKLKKIFFFSETSFDRFNRLVIRDGNKRLFSEILARFQITEYSESRYFLSLVNSDMLIVGGSYNLQGPQFLPLEVPF